MLGFNPIKRFGDSVETVDGTPFSAASQGHWNLSYAAEEERRKKVQYFNGQKGTNLLRWLRIKCPHGTADVVDKVSLAEATTI